MDKGLRLLEFHKILEEVSQRAFTSPGKQLALDLAPSPDREGAEVLRMETLHASELIEEDIEPTLSSLEPLMEAAENLKAGAVALDPVLIRGTGQALSDMGVFFRATAAVPDRLQGVLHGYFSDLPDLHELAGKLIRITTPDGNLSPSASPELKRISRRIESLRSSLGSKLSSIISRYAGTGILRDSPPTMRSGRFVLPVTAARKNSVKGLVHDRSDSGATVFIEPSELVEAGNELQEAVLDMEQERRRILRETTGRIREELPAIETGIGVLSELDLIYARARYHLENETAFPEEGPMDLKNLVHPLLPVETAVRSDIRLPGDWRVLVVSGPNAGGKSVMLKAVALASVCSRAGLGAHTGESSSIPFFSRIMVSMGDNQSIAMHLSTYSARLSEQRQILEEGGSETLAIVDEPAAGTDPVTGAALSSVYLERIADAGVRAIVSTHMGQLKLLAMEKSGFINGSMSFNPETLAPGYRFVPDLPGASCTLEAAAIAGFPRDLLDEASDLAGDSFSLDSLVASLLELEEARKTELEKLKTDREAESLRNRDIHESLSRARKELEEAAWVAEKERAEKLRNIESRADSLLATMAGSGGSDERVEARRKLSELAGSEASEIHPLPHSESGRSPAEITQGDRVIVNGWPDTGTVEKMSRSTAMVRLGSMLLKKDLTDLTKVDTPAERTLSSSEYQPLNESPEAMLLGMTVDEALVELDIKLDNCTALGLRRLRVVHGKGRLMRGVTDWLRKDRRVRSVSLAAPEEGGTGASVVLLKG